MGIPKIFIFHKYYIIFACKRQCNWKVLNCVIMRHDMFSTSAGMTCSPLLQVH